MEFIGHFIADRLHVSTSDRDVVRAAREMFTPEARRALDKLQVRHAMYRAALVAHHENRAEYQQVMGGTL